MSLDQQSQQNSRLSNLEVEEKAANAQAALNDPIINDALNDIYSRAEGILLDADIGSLTASAAHATMKAIKDIKNQLNQYIADNKIRQKYHKGGA